MDHFGELEAQQRARYEAVQRTIAVRREERARNLAWEREQAAARDREARAQRQAVLDRAYEENQRRVAQNRAKYGF